MSKFDEASDVVTTAIRKDKYLWEAFASNIAMAFKDEAARHRERTGRYILTKKDLHEISNVAANDFLETWTVPKRSPAKKRS